MKHATLIAFSVASVVSSLAAATGQDAHPLRYRLDAVPSPAAADTSCLPGHTARTIPRGINDFGSVAADYTCYIADFNGIPASQSAGQAFVWSPWLGTRLIPRAADARGVNAQSVNNRGDVFGREISLDGSTYGFRSTLYGAYERVFESPPECSKIDGAAAGNLAGYIVGFGLRADPSGACAVKWLIRTPAGAMQRGSGGTGSLGTSTTGTSPWAMRAARRSDFMFLPEARAFCLPVMPRLLVARRTSMTTAKSPDT